MILKKFLAVVNREFIYMWRDTGLRKILLFGSTLGFIIFAATYSAQVLKDIPAAVVDLDRSGDSRQLVQYIEQAEDLEVIAYPESYEEMKEMIERGEIVVGVVIPENFGKNLSAGRQSRVLAVIDGSNIIYANNASTALLTVTRSYGARIGIKTLLSKGIHYSQAEQAYHAIAFRDEPWFNPTLNYTYFVVLALALNVWQQCCTLVACTNIIGETGMNSWKQIKAAGVSKFMLFFSKSAAHIVTFMLVVFPVYFLAFVVFKLPLECNHFMLLLFTLVFAVALHAVGTLISSYAASSVDATRFGMVIALPSFILSGYTWPLEAMPCYVQQAAKILPQTWFFQGINYLMFKNPGWDFMSSYFLVLLGTALVCYCVAAAAVYRS